MIDNFELVKHFFDFDDKSRMFLYCQIMKRNKDYKPNKVDQSIINSYFITSIEYLDKVRDDIIMLCEKHGARAYIGVSGKSFDVMRDGILMKFVKDVVEHVYQNPIKIFHSVAGEIKPVVAKWIIDIDDVSIKNNIIEWLDCYFKKNKPYVERKQNERYFSYIEIPTVNG